MTAPSITEGLRPAPTTVPAHAARHVFECDDFAALINTGFEGGAELALWRRPVPTGMADAFQQIDFRPFRDFRVEGNASDIRASAQLYLDQLGWPGQVSAALLSDIDAILQASASTSARYTLRLEYVADDACRKFHKDNTDIRLITTYHGRGSQWINTCTGADEPEIQEMVPYEVAMFLGEREYIEGSVFHRSPPIRAEGSDRFLLVMDIERQSEG